MASPDPLNPNQISEQSEQGHKVLVLTVLVDIMNGLADVEKAVTGFQTQVTDIRTIVDARHGRLMREQAA
jgi:hypothetical protein